MDLVLDIGGTKTRAGIVGDARKLLDTYFFPTNKNFDEEINIVQHFINDKEVRIVKICVGLPGVLDKSKETLYSAPNLRDWVGVPIMNSFKNRFSSEVFLENDAALAGLGESVYGSGKDFGIVAYLTISTGIGGVRIINKYIDHTAYGFEPGHHLIFNDSSDTQKHLHKNYISFENLTSGKSIKKIYGKNPEEITDRRIWGRIMENLSIGIVNTICYWSPDVIVLGGGVTHSDNFDLELLKKMVKKFVKNVYPGIPEIKKSILGDFSGIYGGIHYLERYSGF